LALRGPSPPAPRRVLVPIVVALAAFLVLASTERVGFVDTPPWRAIGIGGSSLWTLRFLVQWWISEQRGEAVLPRSFWWCSLLGSLLLLCYAVRQEDLVFILANLPGAPIYVRNLMWLRRGATA
jgi:lipid-A-disaccharide synthase-like uncharacterized protein